MSMSAVQATVIADVRLISWGVYPWLLARLECLNGLLATAPGRNASHHHPLSETALIAAYAKHSAQLTKPGVRPWQAALDGAVSGNLLQPEKLQSYLDRGAFSLNADSGT